MNNTSARAVMQYTEQAGITAAPDELLVMLLNAEIKNIRIAINAIKNKKIPDAHTRLIKAQDIIDELIMSLDMNYEISKDLMTLYCFIKEKLVEANIKKDADILEQLVPMVTELRDTWAQASKIVRAKQKVV